MKELIILGSDPSAEDCPFDAEIWETSAFDMQVYPKDEIVAEFGVDYFTSDVSYMIALAVYLKYEKIRFYGVDMRKEHEDKVDKSRVTFWLGVARGRGVLWEITESSRFNRVMKENIKTKYRGIRAGGRRMSHSHGFKEFTEKARAGKDPFTFISGVDTSAITVTILDAKGKVMP